MPDIANGTRVYLKGDPKAMTVTHVYENGFTVTVVWLNLHNDLRSADFPVAALDIHVEDVK